MSDNIVFLDTETMGLNPDAPVWEFAAIRCRPGLPVQKREFLIEHDPGNWLRDPDWPQAMKDDYQDRYHPASAVAEWRAVEEINYVTNGAVIVGCNPGFDIERLTTLMRRNGIEPSWHYHPDDIASMAAAYLAAHGQCPPRPWKSDHLSRLIGVDPDQYARHTAMGDVRWCQAQYAAIMGGTAPAAMIDVAHLARQREFSLRTFGPGARTDGVLDHIAKELDEIRKAPGDLSEWADVIILALDGAWRTGAKPQAILDAIWAKQAKNEARTWPDWRTQDPNKAIEHDRSDEPFVTAGPVAICEDGAVIQA